MTGLPRERNVDDAGDDGPAGAGARPQAVAEPAAAAAEQAVAELPAAELPAAEPGAPGPAGPGWWGLVRRTGAAGVVSTLAVVLPPIGGMLIFGFLPRLAAYLRSHESLAVPVYVGFFWAVGGLALLPTYAYSTLAGWTFGFPLGLAAALTAIVGASSISFVLARWTCGNRVPDLIAENPRWHAVYRYLLRGGFWRTLGVVTLLRLPPNSPYALGNVLLAAARVAPMPYALGTLFGLAPRTAVVVFFGSHVEGLDLRGGPREWGQVLIGLAVTVAVLVIIGSLARRALAQIAPAEA